MKEELTETDVTLEFERGWYRFPLEALADDEYIADEYDLYDYNTPGGFIPRTQVLYEWLLHEDPDLSELKEVILERWNLGDLGEFAIEFEEGGEE